LIGDKKRTARNAAWMMLANKKLAENSPSGQFSGGVLILLDTVTFAGAML